MFGGGRGAFTGGAGGTGLVSVCEIGRGERVKFVESGVGKAIEVRLRPPQNETG
jgi:hypothetical protein